jgi:hypothetical protein
MMQHDIPQDKPGLLPFGTIELINYGKLKPLARIIKKANDFTLKNHICNCSSVHRRKTDLHELIRPKLRSNAEHYYKFIDMRPEEENIFLMTDNRNTQILFIEHYRKSQYKETAQSNGSRIIIYDIIPSLPSYNTSVVHLRRNIADGGCTVNVRHLNETTLPSCYRCVMFWLIYRWAVLMPYWLVCIIHVENRFYDTFRCNSFK